MKPITLSQYAKMVGSPPFKTLQEIQDYVEENHDLTLWDYPLEESDSCRKVALVQTDFGLRLCEM